jgi:hypothetical protein
MPATTAVSSAASTAMAAVTPPAAGIDDVITAADLKFSAADQRLGDDTPGGGENPPVGGS